MALFRFAATVGGYTMISRILGFARDILIAATVGAGPVADAFFVAFKLPNFFRRLFAEGAFNAGFVPLFTEILQRDGREAAQAFAERALSLLLVTLLLFVTAFQIAMPWVMHILAPGFVDEPEKFELAVLFTRLTFPYLLFISLVSLMGGVLNSLQRFAAVAATPILLNITLICAITLATPWLPTPGHALAWGVAVAGMVQFLWLILSCRRAGIVLRLPWPRLTPRVRQLLRLILPAALGAGVVQVNLVIDIILASLLPEGSVSYLFYADRLNQLPIGVVGVAVGVALLPMISRQVAAGAEADAQTSMNRAIELSLLLSVPAAVAFAVAPEALIGALFQRGAFGAQEAQATAYALMAYAVGLPAYVLVKVLGPGYFGRKDTITPVRISVVAVAVNLVLNIILMQFLLHAGLALATAISAWLSVGLLAAGLYRRGHLRPDARLRRRSLGILLASALMGVALWFVVQGLGGAFVDVVAVRVGAVAVLIVVGLLVYCLAAQLLRGLDVREIKTLVRGRAGG